jgi:hypothetical protein
MKILVWLLALGVVVFHTSCEMHSATVTVEGYAEKQAEREAKQEKKLTTGEPVNPDAPSFFSRP